MPKADLDPYAESVIFAYCSRKDIHAQLAAHADNTEQIEAIRKQIADIQSELDDLADQVGRGELRATTAARAEPGILKRLQEAQKREKELATPSSALRELIDTKRDIREHWADMPMSAKREVARILFSPELIGELRVTRAPSRGHRAEAEQRVQWHHTDDTDR